MTPQFLYRAYDANDELLYLGVSYNAWCSKCPECLRMMSRLASRNSPPANAR